MTRNHVNKGVIAEFDRLITACFENNMPHDQGLPTVKHSAEQLHFSANYLSDLLKKETGKNAQEHIHYYLIDKDKNHLLSTNDSVREITFNLGFEYPQYFSEIFK